MRINKSSRTHCTKHCVLTIHLYSIEDSRKEDEKSKAIIEDLKAETHRLRCDLEKRLSIFFTQLNRTVTEFLLIL